MNIQELKDRLVIKEDTIVGYYDKGQSGLLESVKYLILPDKVDGITIKVIGSGAFQGCKLEKVVMPSYLEVIQQDAFNLSWVKEVVLNEGIREIHKAAFYHSALETMNFPDSITKIGENAFTSCNLREVILPLRLRVLGDAAFSQNKLKHVRFRGHISKIPQGCFQFNELETLGFPDYIKEIGDFAFANNPTLTHIDLGNVRSIGRYAFYRSGILDLVLPFTIEVINDCAFSEGKMRSVRNMSHLVHIFTQAFAHNQIDRVEGWGLIRIFFRRAFHDNLLQNVDLSNAETVNPEAFTDNPIIKVTLNRGLIEKVKTQALGDESYVFGNNPGLNSVLSEPGSYIFRDGKWAIERYW